MKHISLFISFLFISLVNGQNLEELYNKVNSSVVYIDIVTYDYSNTIIDHNVNTQASSGSGVLVSNDGYIWTAAHVVQSAEDIKVEFNDGDTYEAEVISSNPNADVALIKIKGEFTLRNKYIPQIGDSDSTNIGEDVFIIGAPYGFKQSLSKGIVSGKHYPENLSNDFEKIEFLQTDASINPGNSGGPMFNMQGEVIGIASRIYTVSGGFDGIGFAISSNIAKKLLASQENSWTGMESILLSKEMASLLNVPQESGILILHLSTKGTMAKLGLVGGLVPSKIAGRDIMLGGDIIIEIAGIKITKPNDIYLIKKRINSTPPGDELVITVLRGGQIIKFPFKKE